MSGARRPILLALGLATALAVGSAAAQQPQPPPPQPPPQQLQLERPDLPPGHPPLPLPGAQPPGQPGQPPIRPFPTRPNPMPPGLRPPGRPMPGHGGRAAPEEHGSHGGEEHCPGHGPDDPPEHINWWHGLIGVNNEAAESGSFINQLLWRYNNPGDPCDKKNEPPPYLAALLNFSLLAWIVYRYGKKPLAEALVKRKQTIMREIDDANDIYDNAKQRLKDYEDKLERLEETLAELKAEHVAQAEAEKKQLLAELEERRARMRRDAEFRIEQELKAARAELLQEAVRSAVAEAEAIVRRQANAQDLDRLAEDYLHAIPVAMNAMATPDARSTLTSGAST